MAISRNQRESTLRPQHDPDGACVITDDPQRTRRFLERADVSPSGPVVVTQTERTDGGSAVETMTVPRTDGRTTLRKRPDPRTGPPTVDAALAEADIETAILVFERRDRAAFFRALRRCRERGVDAKVPTACADAVLTDGDVGVPDADLTTVELEPWDPAQRRAKRAFDVALSLAGLLVCLPVMLLIALAVKVDSPGPVLYSQRRTTLLGRPFRIYKFRSMVENAESGTGAVISDEDAGGVDPRVTRLGFVLRRTHLDELPQLWSILRGDMSVVGPRPERLELDEDIAADLPEWRKRWFVKPGLTGLAQINDVTGHRPQEKLRYDLEYVRRQSMSLDVVIFLTQITAVVTDAVGLFGGGESRPD